MSLFYKKLKVLKERKAAETAKSVFRFKCDYNCSCFTFTQSSQGEKSKNV